MLVFHRRNDNRNRKKLQTAGISRIHSFFPPYLISNSSYPADYSFNSENSLIRDDFAWLNASTILS